MCRSAPSMAEGLSPRVRGNLYHWHARQRILRSIPACAGEPNYGNCIGGWQTVYPRVCGGTGIGSRQRGIVEGLSPRVRGNPQRAHRAGRRGGSIPACAGEPRRIASARASARVYPRVCGGTWLAQGAHIRPYGLSPRVRGNHQGFAAGRADTGSIPACAGEPPSRKCAPSPSMVYPRVCGGTSGPPAARRSHRGLSPRVRGNPPTSVLNVTRRGSIPACAGEPRRDILRVNWFRSIPACAGEPAPPSSE